MVFKSRKKLLITLTLVFIIVLGVFLRVRQASRYLFWQDEAESAIYALQILDIGYPHSEFRGEILYENDLVFPSDDSKYQYQSTNYIGSKYEKNKGWLPHYLIALSFKVLGVSDFNARLSSIIISIFTLLVLYNLVRLFFKPVPSLFVVFLYAINYIAIYYEAMSRYFSLELLLVTLNLYLFYLFIKTKKDKYFFFTTLGLILLFHTHIIVCLTMMIFFIGYHLATQKSLELLKHKTFGLSLFLFLLATIPWLILVNFFSIQGYIFAKSEDKIAFFVFILLNIVGLFTIKYLYKFVTNRDLKFDLVTNNFFYLFSFFVISALSIILLLPAESLFDRAFLVVLPIFIIFIPYTIIKIFQSRGQFQYIVLLAFFVFWWSFIFTSLGLYFNVYTTDSFLYHNLTEPLTRYSEFNELSNDTLILTAMHTQFPLMFYTNHRVQIIRALQCEYLENYDDRIIFISKKQNMKYFYFHKNLEEQIEFKKLVTCLEYNRVCNLSKLSDTIIYDCISNK